MVVAGHVEVVDILRSNREVRFRALHADVFADVVRFLRRRAPSVEADDVAAEVFLIAWRRLDDIPAHPSEARAWLFGVARGCLLNTTRGASRRVALAVKLAEVGGAEAASVTSAEDIVGLMDLATAWRSLAAVESEALSLAVFEELSSAEAAAVLGITPTAYRLRLSRARKARRRHLGQTGTAAVLQLVPSQETTA